jgi:D-aminoacyl-tRNA deacylase
VQRVREARVEVDGERVGEIGQGLLVLVGVKQSDTEADARYIAEKVAGLRIFGDAEGRMNLPVAEVGGGVLLVSQFTLHGDARKGRRPSYSEAAPPEQADALYQRCAELIAASGVPVETGRFRAMMDVNLVNEGPVTILLDSERNF